MTLDDLRKKFAQINRDFGDFVIQANGVLPPEKLQKFSNYLTQIDEVFDDVTYFVLDIKNNP